MVAHRHTRHISLLATGAAISVALLSAYYYFNIVLPEKNCTLQYRFTSSELNCSQFDESRDIMQRLDSALNSAVLQYVNEKRATRISIFTRDLRSKQWAGANQYELFAPASLIKVPIMLAYFKMLEIEPSIMQKQIENTISEDQNGGMQYPPKETLIYGQRYTVEDLLTRMAVNSDNTAATLLYQSIEPTFFANVLADIGLQLPHNDGPVDIATAKSYANVFRILYNASFINREYSEKTLELLSRPHQFEGIKSSLPQNTPVADKYGERLSITGDGAYVQELHDCGIVYKGAHAYTICIMTEGDDYEKLHGVIKDLSALVYSYM